MKEKHFTNRTLYQRFEGGAVYTAEEKGAFLVVIDESAIADILPLEEVEGLELIKIIKFETEPDRTNYLSRRFG